jgi:virginiamycin A acetyltransferase
MYIDISVQPYEITKIKTYYAEIKPNDNPFPIMTIDKDSYIVQARIETSIDFNVLDGVHNFQIGKYSSLAEDILFLIDENKDYKKLSMGAISAMQGKEINGKINNKRKGQIIIQNDCWIGNGATILSGVTIHDGAIVAAKSVVTKDVPPYAIVGGNPAKILKYRFNDEQIKNLQKISWWNWKKDKIIENSNFFYGEVAEFINKHISETNKILDNIPSIKSIKNDEKILNLLFIPDFYEPYPIYEKVLSQFINSCEYSQEKKLIVFINDDLNVDINKEKILKILSRTRNENNSAIYVYIDKVEDERSLFKNIDFYITTRAEENIQRMNYANLYNVKCISGVDLPIFDFVLNIKKQ